MLAFPGVVMPSLRSVACSATRLWRAFAVTALIASAAAPGIATAQTADCDRLQATIDSMPRGDGGGAARLQQAAARQRSELARTHAYANSLGCEKRSFLIFGEQAPPQCGTVQAQIQRMRGNLAQLESSAAAAGGGNDSRRRALMARYNANCGQVAPPQQAAAPRPRDRGFFETLFGANEPPRQQQALIPPQPDLTQIPLEAPRPKTHDPEEGGQTRGAHGGNVAVCVRSCDGGFFPITYSAGRGDMEDLAALCTAMCPNAAANIYTYSGASDIETAVSLDGVPYRALPTAFRYRTTFDPSCSCKAPNQTWVAALSDAERLLTSGGGHDVVVTEQKAEELSRPQFTPSKAKTAKTALAKGDALKRDSSQIDKADLPALLPAPLPAPGGAPVAPTDDGQAAKEATSGASVATASQETTGIAAGDGGAAATLTRDQGVTQDITVNGVKKRVRIIGPKL